ncbi:hypothetical protein BDW59DRAFT_181920 [Aspergillus cavernicola]|uniref:NAD(P)-binding protein n=1 Tax=Aspergillus cavernicola TaxID=176166 RepID=A0ABR4HSV7_9EURO
MPFYNTQLHFLYRQLFLTPSPPPPSLNLNGQAGIITGSNTGLGYEAASQLISLGLSRLILAVRTISKGEAARKKLLDALLQSNNTPPVIEVWELDMSSYSSIIAFVERVKLSGSTFNFAILNAGVFSFRHTVNESTGNEESIQVNWLSTALLTLLLLPVFDASSTGTTTTEGQQQANNNNTHRPTLTIVNSEVAAWAKFKEAAIATKQGKTLLETLNDNKYFISTDRYFTSKLLQQLFFLELFANHRSNQGRSSRTVINLVNPGLCKGSDLHRNGEGIVGKGLAAMKQLVGRTVPVGARTLVHAAVVAGPESDGKFLSDTRVSPFARDGEKGKKMQKNVWDEMVGELRKVVDTDDLLGGV